MFDLLERFDLLLLLQMDGETRQLRLADPTRNNAFGRVGDTAAWSSWRHRTVESEMLKRGAVAVNANRAVDDVVASVCEQISR